MKELILTILDAVFIFSSASGLAVVVMQFKTFYFSNFIK